MARPAVHPIAGRPLSRGWRWVARCLVLFLLLAASLVPLPRSAVAAATEASACIEAGLTPCGEAPQRETGDRGCDDGCAQAGALCVCCHVGARPAGSPSVLRLVSIALRERAPAFQALASLPSLPPIRPPRLA